MAHVMISTANQLVGHSISNGNLKERPVTPRVLMQGIDVGAADFCANECTKERKLVCLNSTWQNVVANFILESKYIYLHHLA